MLVILGAIIVTASVMGGFIMAGGHPVHLIQVAEFVVICGAALGAMVIMAPKKVILDLFKQLLGTLKGALHGGANEESLTMLQEIGSPERVESWILKRLARKEIGLVDPPPTDVRRVAVVDGRINEVGALAVASGDGGAAPGRAAAKAPARRPSKRAPRAHKTTAAPEGGTEETAVEAGVGVLPIAGAVQPKQESGEAP